MLKIKENKKLQVLFGICIFIILTYFIYSYYTYQRKQAEIIEGQKQILENQKRHEQTHQRKRN